MRFVMSNEHMYLPPDTNPKAGNFFYELPQNHDIGKTVEILFHALDAAVLRNKRFFVVDNNIGPKELNEVLLKLKKHNGIEEIDAKGWYYQIKDTKGKKYAAAIKDWYKKVKEGHPEARAKARMLQEFHAVGAAMDGEGTDALNKMDLNTYDAPDMEHLHNLDKKVDTDDWKDERFGKFATGGDDSTSGST